MIKKWLCGALTALMTTGILVVVSAAPANATPTNLSVTPSDPTPGATTALSFNISSFQTSATMKCIQLQYSGGYKPKTTLYNWDASAQGWGNSYGNITSTAWDNTQSRTGAGSLAMTGTTTASGYAGFASGIYFSSPTDMSANGNAFSVWAYLPNGSPGTWYGNIFVTDASNTYYHASALITPGQWSKITFVVPATVITNIHSVIVQIDSYNAGGSRTVNVDDFQQGNSVNASPTGTDMPTGMSVSNAYVNGGYTNSNTFSPDNTLASTGIMAYNNASGTTPTGSSASFLNASVTEPITATGQDVFVTFSTFAGLASNGLCTGTQLDGPVVFEYATYPSTAVSATVDPTFTFTVAGQASTCNGDTNWVTGVANATSVPIGHMSINNIFSAGQALTVSSNAGSGFSVYVRGTQASQNLRSVGHNFTDVAGTYASPATIGAGEQFGYTWKDSTASTSITNPGSGALAALTNATTNKIMGSATSATGSGCIGYDVQTSATTPAGSYSATVIYTAIPSF